MQRSGGRSTRLRHRERSQFRFTPTPPRANGASTFAECPGRAAPVARLFWHAAFDPHVVSVCVEAAEPEDPEALDLTRLGPHAVFARGDDGREYLSVSDGSQRLRLDVVEGSLGASARVRLHYRLSGFTDLEPQLRVLRRLLALRRDGVFGRALRPHLPRMAQRLEALRVADALADGASYRDVAIALFGIDRVREEWGGRSDFLLSRVRRRTDEARRMASGDYRMLFRS
jgi:hypothetical protein